MRTIERTAIVRFEDAEVLFEESAVHAVGQQLRRLIEDGHTRLVVNFGGIRYLSSEVLGILAGLHKRVEQAAADASNFVGSIRYCGRCCRLPISTGCSTSAAMRRRPWG